VLIRIAKYVLVVDALNVKLPIDLIKTFVFRFVNQDITRKIEFANNAYPTVISALTG